MTQIKIINKSNYQLSKKKLSISNYQQSRECNYELNIFAVVMLIFYFKIAAAVPPPQPLVPMQSAEFIRLLVCFDLLLACTCTNFSDRLVFNSRCLVCVWVDNRTDKSIADDQRGKEAVDGGHCK